MREPVRALLILLACSTLFPFGAAPDAIAAVYQCRGADGSTAYSDIPCSPDARPLTPTPVADRAPASLSAEQVAAAPRIARALYVSPRNGQQLDITAALASLCLSTVNSCEVRCNNQLAGDPDFGQRKHCEITYRCGSGATQELRIQEGDTRTLRCAAPTPREAPAAPAASAIQPPVDAKALHCGVSLYVQWSRSQTEPPAPEVKAAKLKEIDDRCGSTLHLSNVQSGYDSALNRAHSPGPALAVTPPTASSATRESTSSAASAPAPSKAASPPKYFGEFPVVPEKQLPMLKGIPHSGAFAVEVGESFGRHDTEPMTYRADITIFDLTSHREYRWDLPRALLEGLPPTGSMHRAGWAPGTSELLFAKLNEAFLISRDGHLRALSLLMPGHLKPFDPGGHPNSPTCGHPKFLQVSEV